MKTIKKVAIIPVFVEQIPEQIEHGKIYISEKYKCSVHLCLCGCGMQTVLPIGKDGWNMYKTDKGVSFTPSVGNFQYPCKSHYIITNNIANFV